MHISFKKTFLALIITLSLFSANIADAAQKTLLAFGDSLTAGKGLALEKAFPAQLQEALQKLGYDVKVINAGVSGETTSGGLARLEWTIQQQKPDFAILELGANDMLRGIDPAVPRENLDKMLKIFRDAKIPVLLVGMQAMPNLGPEYQRAYDKMYPALAKKYGVVYYPFFLDGVELHSRLMQRDGIHPTAEGIAVIVKGILPSVRELLDGK